LRDSLSILSRNFLIDDFIDRNEFKKQIDDWIQVFRNTKPAPGTNGPLIPGDPEPGSGSNPKQRTDTVVEACGG
jgi:LDH2 family malate/lactate/ureidoglycolate dehydrogenase